MKDFKHYLSIVNESMSNSHIQNALMKLNGMTPKLASKIERELKNYYSDEEYRDKYAAKIPSSFIFYTVGNQKEKNVYDRAKANLEVEASDDPKFGYVHDEFTLDGNRYGVSFLYNAFKAEGPPPRFRNMYDSEPGIDRSQYE